ncbi:DUF4349 domain-containing protein [Nesterenkonia sp. PF2B19]|uniref:DUF4349 domain-containing protein n=1 Tax=unclassified Nesterenkonia TaxID=2629769 RepID=UPI0009F632D5|nr:DUF4349 domain-containing protein [Nesterenkonia sp. PF2B19]OSM42803.1 hypothetical protein BCY76_012225 [Nesterenkonia sp. PF2B19]
MRATGRARGAGGAVLRGLQAVAALVVAVLLLTGCGAGDGEADGAEGGEWAVDHEAAEDFAPEAPGQERTRPDADAEDREVVTTASAEVEVRDVAEAVTSVVEQVEGYGGHVEARRESTDDDGRLSLATLTLRVPAEDLAELLDDLEGLGDVHDLSQRAQDVTGTARDLDARIEALEISVDRLLEIMEQAETSEELLAAETTLSDRQTELESLVSQRDALADQVEMSTLRLELIDGRVAAVRADGFVGGLQSGWNGLLRTADGVLVVAGVLVPWIPVLVVAGVGVGWLVRRDRRRRELRRQAWAGVAVPQAEVAASGTASDEEAVRKEMPDEERPDEEADTGGGAVR